MIANHKWIVWLRMHKREVILFVLFFLISTTSFALGYLFAKETAQVPIVIEKHSSLDGNE